MKTKTASRRNKRLASSLLAASVFVCLLAARILAEGEEPRAVVDKTTNAVIVVLQNKQLSSAEKRTKIEEIVYAEVDFDTLSKLVLARNWSQLNPAQKDEFMREFKRHLSVTLLTNRTWPNRSSQRIREVRPLVHDAIVEAIEGP